ncbi:hypothetical protein Ae201684P_007186 [Aphanomyces euteiches]|uniref:Major facilitator superfamily (MFS) profile domain-containing protein n=1 Tax=Aphanomyces euteiches TaxID=100861 RepID=A0A6G0WQW3_9STRA|nr:hypothetical protein Ae201684_012613 [Aphanomyces euteiches]KAH9100997.1 hypothetical protein Ae201684P_007186 [Aphanomyces euteiches]
MCLAACLGYVMATVAADGMVVQYAQREPASIRGRTQTAMCITRDAYSILPMLLVGFCMSDYKYGGDFTWSVEPNGIFWFVVIPCVLAAVAAIFLLVETPDAATISLRRYMNSLWELLEHRLIWQL